MLRDPNKDLGFFNENIEFFTGAIDRALQKIQTSTTIKDYPGAVQGLLLYIFQVTVLCYSRGDNIDALRGPVMQWIEGRELREKINQKYLPPETRTPRTMYVRLTQDMTYDCLSMLAFGRALHFTKAEMQRLLNAVGHPGEDALLDEAAKALGDSTRQSTPECKFPQAYGKLLEVWRSPAEQRAAKLQAYAKVWYRKMRGTHWHDTLDSGDAYFGYWCFDIALAAIVLNIDDAALRSNPYYPADLVDYARRT